MVIRVLSVLSILFASFLPSGQKAVELIEKMTEAIDNVHKLTYTMHKQERIEGELAEQKVNVKMQTSPFKVYLKQEFPKEGLEVLYVEGKNNGKAYVNTNGFPWVTLRLKPLGQRMREGQHHSLLESGFKHIGDIVDYQVHAIKSKDKVKLLKDEVVGDQQCYHIVYDNPDFTFEEYTVKEGEDVMSIAKLLYVNAYMILEKNDDISWYDDVKAGQVIKVPNVYAKKLDMYIGKESKLPVKLLVYDDQGLFQQYEYQNVDINPAFDENTFVKTNKDYGF